MDDIVVVDELRKVYGKDILAVDGIFFRVHKGEIFGFLGPNGAGKSAHEWPGLITSACSALHLRTPKPADKLICIVKSDVQRVHERNA